MIISFNDLEPVKKKHQNEIVLFADGVFDLFHVGHVKYLQTLQEKADIVIVGIMSDSWVQDKKGIDRPIYNHFERANIVDTNKFTDYTIILEENSDKIKTSEVFKKLKPNIFASTDLSWKARWHQYALPETELQIMDCVMPNVKTKILKRSTSKTLDFIRQF